MKFSTKTMIICALAVVVNVVLGEMVSMMKIPLLFLDTIGTIFIAASFGMSYEIITRVTTNLLMEVISGPTAIPFALVNVAVAIVVSLMARGGNFTLIKAIIAGLILSFVAPMIGAPIRIVLIFAYYFMIHPSFIASSSLCFSTSCSTLWYSLKA